MTNSGASPMGAPELSVVVPVYNEADNLDALIARLVPVLERVASSHEIVFVDDGSSDASRRKSPAPSGNPVSPNVSKME